MDTNIYSNIVETLDRQYPELGLLWWSLSGINSMKKELSIVPINNLRILPPWNNKQIFFSWNQMYSAVSVPKQVSGFQWGQTNLLWTCSFCHTIAPQYGYQYWYLQISNPVSCNWKVEAIITNIYSRLVSFDLSTTRNWPMFRTLLKPHWEVLTHSISGTLNATCCSVIDQIRNG